MKAIVFVAIGASDVLKVKEDWAELNLPANEVHAEIDYTGVKFVDTYQGPGLYPIKMPAVAGREGAGIIRRLSTQVALETYFVAVSTQGTYAQFANAEVTHVMRLSDKTSTKDAPERPSCFRASLPCHSFAMRMKSGKMTGYSACPRTSSRVKHCDSELMPVQPWEAHIRRSDGRGWMLWWCRRYGAGRGPSHSKCLRC